MTKLILVSLLLTMVYSWEEFKRALHLAFYSILRKKRPLKYFALHVDRYISTIVLIAVVPMSLTYLLSAPGDIFQKLRDLTIVLLMFAVAAEIAAVLLRYFRLRSIIGDDYNSMPAVLSLGSLVSPKIAAISGTAGLPRSIAAKFALFLSLPPFVGLILKKFTDAGELPPSSLPNIDALILVLVGALFLRVTIEFLERYFRIYRFKSLFSYFRIILGIALACLLLFRVF